MPAKVIRVDGLVELDASLKELDVRLDKELRSTLKEIAEPVRQRAERLAVTDISGIRREVRAGLDPKWARMRLGVSARLVYVVPKERGLKYGARKRPKFGSTLYFKALEPAFATYRGEILPEVDVMLKMIIHEAGF